ncbi:AarF/UbiB family protein [Iamia majanohamensis]|uniref:AarF/UbiB family protein n=1 Tax=Iamia majanohamensis TaxID=467976 RepID=A0AAE9Y6Y1_9ACTN|nr:AarF/UbiB family protein [Iamia majanohamensis]WCO65488.1 AarF/UbiB family protein [Iamia majanohamensis]
MAPPTSPDLALGTFTASGPWVIDPDALPWRRAVAEERARLQRRLPDLVRPRRLPPLGRLARVLGRLGPPLGAWAIGARRQGGTASRADLARRLRLAAEALGPTYIKLGQIIASGEGLFPAELVAEMRACRDQVPPETFAAVRAVVEEDLGRPLEDVFARFDRRPLAAASIAQVHAAALHPETPDGEPVEVVVKVQRPGIKALVEADLQVMATIAPLLVGRIPIAALANPPALVELFGETITEELDFRLEADNMLDVAAVYAQLGRSPYVVPRPHPTLVTRRVLVMERLSGFAFEDVAGMRAADIDTTEVVRSGMIGFLEGAMLHGIFHGDLHAGNLFVLPDGRTALLDFGITGRMGDVRRRAFLRLLVSATMNDLRGQLAAIRDLGALPPDVDLEGVIRDLDLEGPVVDPTNLTPEQLTGEIQKVVKGLIGYGAKLPKELMLFIKNLVFLDGAIATLAPDLDLFAEITHVATYFATEHGARIAGEVGVDEDSWNLDMGSVRALYGVEEGTQALTHRELQQRREVIAQRYAQRQRGGVRRRLRARVRRRG